MKNDKTRGWYLFADGTEEWFFGLTPQEKRRKIHEHGRIVRFIPTP